MTAMPTSPYLCKPLRTEAEARRDRLINVQLTIDELTRLMCVLEAAKDEAHKASVLAVAPRNPYHPPMPPDLDEKLKEAALQHSAEVADLCERISDIWKESRG